MKPNLEIRLIEAKDTAGALAVYEPYVISTPVTFEYEVPSLEDFAKKIKTNTSKYPWLVCLQNGVVIGYAYASDFRYRAAYQWSHESTIYLSEAAQGKGLGRILYETLFSVLTLQGYYNVFAGVAIPNKKSEGLHTSLGFEDIGIFRKVGYKLGQWHDTRWFQLTLSPHIYNPATPALIGEIASSAQFEKIIAQANEKLTNIH
jgi:L-amino acid N-acyltransferase YncA